MLFDKFFKSIKSKVNFGYILSLFFYFLPFRILNFFIYLLGFPILCRSKYTSFRKGKSIGSFQWIEYTSDKKIKFEENTTSSNLTRKSFINSFFYTLRQRIDDPLGKKRIKN